MNAGKDAAVSEITAKDQKTKPDENRPVEIMPKYRV